MVGKAWNDDARDARRVGSETETARDDINGELTGGCPALIPTATTSTNRIALSETAYDERGRAWKSTRWEITQANGNKGSSLLATHWFDSAGRGTKTDGEQLAKTLYDRLGRVTHRFTLAKDNDTTYAHAADAAGDIVLEEHQTAYDPVDGNVLMSVTIERRHDDFRTGETTGALDTNADGLATTLTAADVDGRPDSVIRMGCGNKD